MENGLVDVAKEWEAGTFTIVPETDEDIHNALRDTGLDNFVFTACYESQMHIDANFLSDAPAFPTSVSMNA